MNIEDIIKEVKQDSNIDSTLDIDELLHNAENLDTDFLEGKTVKYFMDENYYILKEVGLENMEIETIYEKLKDYRYIEKVCDLKVGRYIRWINISNPSVLTKGGIIKRVEIVDNQINVLCRNFRYFNEFHLDNCWIFQKFTMEEQIYLMLQEK